MKPKKKKTGALYVRNLPVSLLHMFGAACRRRGSNMSREVRQFMEAMVRQDADLVYGGRK